MQPWDEVGDRVYRRRYQSLDLNVGLVLGAEGALLIDTRGSHVQGRELADEVSTITDLPIRWVVNTHWHWDHVFGNAVFPEVPVYGHDECARVLTELGEAARAEVADMVPEEKRHEIEEVEIRPPEETFATSREIDLGGRTVRLEYRGLGHTEGDILTTVSDYPVLFAGDLLEESGPPYFGQGYPIAWPETVAGFVPMIRGTVVPGHGDVMDRAAVENQLDDLRAVARTARSAHAERVPVSRVDLSDAPYPEATMREALRRAYVELGEAGRVGA